LISIEYFTCTARCPPPNDKAKERGRGLKMKFKDSNEGGCNKGRKGRDQKGRKRQRYR